MRTVSAVDAFETRVRAQNQEQCFPVIRLNLARADTYTAFNGSQTRLFEN
jgi:hypothetical protein